MYRWARIRLTRYASERLAQPAPVWASPPAAPPAREPGRVVAFPPERLRGPHAGHVLLEVGVDDADLLPGLGVRDRRLDLEDPGRDGQDRHHRDDHETQLQVEPQQRDQDADEGEH